MHWPSFLFFFLKEKDMSSTFFFLKKIKLATYHLLTHIPMIGEVAKKSSYVFWTIFLNLF